MGDRETNNKNVFLRWLRLNQELRTVKYRYRRKQIMKELERIANRADTRPIWKYELYPDHKTFY